MNGAALLLLALWSIRSDVAWRNLKHKLPLTRYIARCLALGFVWLGIGGGLSLVFGAQVAGPRYDAILHIVFVGFVGGRKPVPELIVAAEEQVGRRQGDRCGGKGWCGSSG